MADDKKAAEEEAARLLGLGPSPLAPGGNSPLAPSHSAGWSEGVPRPGPPAAPIPTPLDIASYPNTATVENMRRSMESSPRSEQSERSLEKPMSEMHADDKAIIIAIGGSAFCAGLFGFYEGHPILGTAFTVGGLITMAPISPFVRSRISWAFGRPALWALAITTWLLLAANLGLSLYSRPTVHPVAVATGDVWTALTPDEKKLLSLAVKLLPTQPHFRIICLTSDCKDLAESLMVAFHDAGWNPVFATSSAFFQEPYGIVLYLKDPNDKSLKDAIEKTTSLKVDHTEVSTDPFMESMFIGIRP